MCIFCMMALTMIATSLSATALGNIETRLSSRLKNVQRSVDTESLAMWKAIVEFQSNTGREKRVPVVIHLYKQHKRARVQILTHDISQDEAEMAQNLICEALEARIISRHFPKHDDHFDQLTQSQTIPPQQKMIQTKMPGKQNRL